MEYKYKTTYICWYILTFIYNNIPMLLYTSFNNNSFKYHTAECFSVVSAALENILA